jgi:hypothetical protein
MRLTAMVLAVLALVAVRPAAGAETSPPAEGSYAVVVSKKTLADKDWRPVVETLKAKYAATVVTWETSVTEARMDLALLSPNYVCFVAQPEEAGRDFVVAVHRMTRRLNDDPYTDCLWGILTGYGADDALRVARLKEPLTLARCLSGTRDGRLAPFDEGVAFDEGKAGSLTTKTAAGKTEAGTCPPDSTKTIVDYFINSKPDCLITSGHATQHDWQIGYSFRGGQLRHKDGQLLALDAQGRRYDITSPNPKVCMPVGNCLIGEVSGRDCMVTSFFHTGGVCQMFGYTVPTWYGQGGWGIQEYFLDQPGRFSLAEAFFANSQALLFDLQARYPKAAGIDLEQYDMERDPSLLNKLATKHGLTDKDALGLLWDRDTVAFYGDPAWQARPKARPLPWDQSLEVKGNRYTLTVTARQDGTWPGKPLVALLAKHIGPVRVIEGAGFKPVIGTGFVMLPMKGAFKAGDKVQVIFETVPVVRR